MIQDKSTPKQMKARIDCSSRWLGPEYGIVSHRCSRDEQMLLPGHGSALILLNAF
jgi:hypothetical protein